MWQHRFDVLHCWTPGIKLFVNDFDKNWCMKAERISKRSWLNVAEAIYYNPNTVLKLILFWLSRTIHLTRNPVAYKITVKSPQVKVRLTLNLKNMRERSTVCRPVWFLFMQLVKCVCVCVCVHVCLPVRQCIMYRQIWEAKSDLVHWVEWVRKNDCMCSCMRT